MKLLKLIIFTLSYTINANDQIFQWIDQCYRKELQNPASIIQDKKEDDPETLIMFFLCDSASNHMQNLASNLLSKINQILDNASQNSQIYPILCIKSVRFESEVIISISKEICGLVNFVLAKPSQDVVINARNLLIGIIFDNEYTNPNINNRLEFVKRLENKISNYSDDNYEHCIYKNISQNDYFLYFRKLIVEIMHNKMKFLIENEANDFVN
ncbi:hypothetical protein FZC35_02315 [Candidatus Cytomitobacter indipagum]|uniref:Uncharacterized protein n=1 Tax=Candidatus Cytomitobacter indipagum TaxID=2601575 RepID=A0A5C0UG01_9PROT|nr:hypothetical protein [Candidatus Cytomitobacter indipagum]QEK38192.1 hypothetical protein FZC35_02315 [Candidatus Cytomitobacter indipagum]